MSFKHETEQGIVGITISSVGPIVSFKCGNKSIDKCIENGFYLLHSLCDFLGAPYRETINYINSYRFKFCLSCFDEDYKIPQYVYYVIFKEEGYVKIGRTFELEQRYSPKYLKDNVKRLVCVEHVRDAEKDLKDAFLATFEQYDETRERFLVKNERKALELFDSVVSKYKQVNVENPHVDYERFPKTTNEDYTVSPFAATIICSMFRDITLPKSRALLKATEVAYNKVNKANYVAVVEVEHHIINYWSYKGYIIITDVNAKLVNISRLWNSICNTELGYQMNIHRFLRTAPITKLVKAKKITIKTKDCPGMPLLNGKWGPLIMVHMMLYYLNANYAFEVSEMLTDLIFANRLDPRTGRMDGGRARERNDASNILLEAHMKSLKDKDFVKFFEFYDKKHSKIN